ncbi:putative transcription factor interactor and regulator Znf-B family [Helianthus annuus]|nr:putative transcription factor interactor and regulator Znf-B family [Helianthus annuus]
MQSVPPWLEKLLSTEFFPVCRTHGDAARSECNMYCLDCNDGAFCFYCKSSKHKEHQVIQVSVCFMCFFTHITHLCNHWI